MTSVRANQQPIAPSTDAPALVLSGENGQLSLSGELNIASLAQAERLLGEAQTSTLDVSGISSLDTPGALLLCGLRDKQVTLSGIRTEHKGLLDLVCGLDLKPPPEVAVMSRWRHFVIQIGKGSHAGRRDVVDIIDFVGRAAVWTFSALIHPSTLRFSSITRHISETGIKALPIVGLMAFMIAIVLGYQGVAQLRPYGGEDFTLNLVAVSVLREMAVLVTAIMVAGRSGSAFTAEIGVMKTREEVDALKMMGIEPMHVLVVPRVIALVITLPLLTFFADIMGLIGGGAIAQILLDVSPAQYLARLRTMVDLSDLFVGLVKAPFFAFFIAIVGCMHGLRVSGSAESLGRETTRAVVKSIFLVFMLDALFSILFEKINL